MMTKSFDNTEYEILMKDLISDAFYAGGSNRGKIATVRQYAEVIIRKILNISHDKQVTLGNKEVLRLLEVHCNKNPLIMNSLEEIRLAGNKCTHTKDVSEILDKDFDDCFRHLLNLYAYIFVSYFEKYKFGSNPNVAAAFSILPPIVRHIALTNLFDGDKDNISIIDRLALATLKAFDKQSAIDWVNERRAHLQSLKAITEEAYEDMAKRIGTSTADEVRNNAPDMYALCLQKIDKVDNQLKKNGRLYVDFEGAKELYKSDGIITGTDPDVVEFNSIMDFVYIGRKSSKHVSLEDTEKYLTLV